MEESGSLNKENVCSNDSLSVGEEEIRKIKEGFKKLEEINKEMF